MHIVIVDSWIGEYAFPLQLLSIIFRRPLNSWLGTKIKRPTALHRFCHRLYCDQEENFFRAGGLSWDLNTCIYLPALNSCKNNKTRVGFCCVATRNTATFEQEQAKDQQQFRAWSVLKDVTARS
jgi:hypothetical protein